MKKVLFICIHNSARSQIAEALLNRIGARHFVAESAGIEPGMLNPLAVAVLNEIGIDIAAKKTRSVIDVIRSGVKYHYVVTVCDETSAEQCPSFPAETIRLHWSFPDPSQFQGTRDEKLAQTRLVRTAIEAKLKEFLRGASK
jgi:arsenate reductase